MRMSFEDLRRVRITGVSVFGVSWQPAEPERETIRQLMIFLEDRRALYNPYQQEVLEDVVESIQGIRTELTHCLQKLGGNSEAIPSVRAMRAACRKFLDQVTSLGLPWPGPFLFRHDPLCNFWIWLGELRGGFGINIVNLCVMYGLDLEGDIAEILPAESGDPGQ